MHETASRGRERPILVTGGAGFIGSCFVRRAVARGEAVVTLDSLTYAGGLAALDAVRECRSHHFVRGDIRDRDLVASVFREHQPRSVAHFAAETHVDRSIDDASAFVSTNVGGTQLLLDCALEHWRSMPAEERETFRFLQVSTDEVFGTLGREGRFSEASPYRPNSPYAASKAGADHLARAWFRTYGLPVLITICGNNYGPYQFPEKLIPMAIIGALEDGRLPVYGDGTNVRDWIHVEEHCAALETVLTRGRIGDTYCISGHAERTNLKVVETVCDILDELAPRADGGSHRTGIEFVPDRPGHDLRYAVDTTKIEKELGWRPRRNFEEGLRETVRWCHDHSDWWEAIRKTRYDGSRLGLI